MRWLARRDRVGCDDVGFYGACPSGSDVPCVLRPVWTAALVKVAKAAATHVFLANELASPNPRAVGLNRFVTFPHGAAVALIIIVAALGVSVLVVLWPTKKNKWTFVASATGILDASDARDATGKFVNDEDAIRRKVIKSLSAGGQTNAEIIAFKSKAFQLAATLLLAEVLLLLWVLLER